jgi:hypothetical protein
MLRKLIIKKIIAVIAGILLSLCIITSCDNSSKMKVTSGNQAEITTMTPMSKINSNVNSEPPDLSKVETVSYCELIKNPTKYDHKIVRVRAIYFNEFERSYLYDETCEIGKTPIAPEKVPAETWAEWDKSFVSKGDSAEAVLNRQLNGFGRKDVMIIGKFNSTNEQSEKDGPNLFGHLGSCRFQFQIMRLEKIFKENDDETARRLIAAQPDFTADSSCVNYENIGGHGFGESVKSAKKGDWYRHESSAFTDYFVPGESAVRYTFKNKKYEPFAGDTENHLWFMSIESPALLALDMSLKFEIVGREMVDFEIAGQTKKREQIKVKVSGETSVGGDFDKAVGFLYVVPDLKNLVVKTELELAKGGRNCTLSNISFDVPDGLFTDFIKYRQDVR